MDEFSVMMVSSGHGVEVVRQTLMSGMKGHIRKVARCEKEGKPFHRCAASSAKSRKSKKLTQKSRWFKNKEDCHEPGANGDEQKRDDEASAVAVKERSRGERRQHDDRPEGGKGRGQVQPSTVLFVEFTKGGQLQKAMREIVDRLVGLLGFSVRVTERAGTPLSSLLCNKNMWKGQDCKREECHICCQPGEKREDCKRTNVLYESGCMD